MANFRRQYYYNLEKHVGFKVAPNISSSLDAIFSCDEIDVDGLRKICLRCTIPPLYRGRVWKVMLNILPYYKESWSFIQQQEREQYEDLKRIGNILFASLGGSDSSLGNDTDKEAAIERTQVMELVRMHNIDQYLDIAANVIHSRTSKNIVDMAKVFCSVFTDPVDAYFCLKKLVNLRLVTSSGGISVVSESDAIDNLIKELLQLVKKKLQGLLLHFSKLNTQLEQFCYSWFRNYFASCLPTHILKKIWDKIIGVGDCILPCYAFAILAEMEPLLLNCKNSSEALNILMMIPEKITMNFDKVNEAAIEIFEETTDSPSPSINRHK